MSYALNGATVRDYRGQARTTAGGVVVRTVPSTAAGSSGSNKLVIVGGLALVGAIAYFIIRRKKGSTP